MSENDEIKQLKILNKIIKESFDGILKHIQKTDKNYRFGAYTPLNWVTPSSGEVNDPKDNLTFLFSLNKMQKYTNNRNNIKIFRRNFNKKFNK